MDTKTDFSSIASRVAIGLLLLVTSHAYAGRQDHPKIQLTEVEQAWVAENHTVRVRVSNWPPFMLTNPEPSGMSVDYIKAIAHYTGLNIQLIPDELGWAASLKDLAEEQKSYDLILTIKRTPEREKSYAFTNDYIFYPWVIITPRESDFIGGMNSLEGKVVAVENAFVIQGRLTQEYPGISQYVAKTSLDALKAVSSGKAHAYIGNLANSTHLMAEHQLDSLKIAAPASIENHNQAMAVRKDWPELASIINKVIEAMNSGEKRALENRWLSIRYDQGVDPVSATIWIISILLVALLLTGTVAYLNRLLSRRLREKEAIYRSVVNDMPGLICRFTPEGIIEYVNQHYCRYFDKTSEELIGSSFYELLPEDEREPVRKSLSTLNYSNPSMQHEHRVIDSHNNIRWQRWTNRVICNNRGKVTLLQSFGEDITDQKQSREELIESERRLATLMGNLSGMVYRCTRELPWEIVFISDACFELTGYTAQELETGDTGSFQALILPEDIDDVARVVEKALKEGGPFETTYRIRKKDGEIRWVWERGRYVTESTDGPDMLEGIVDDITHQKLTEFSLKQSEKQLRTLIDTMPDLVWMKDPDGVYLFCNSGYLDFVGRTEAEVIGKTDYDLHAHSIAEEYRKHDQAAIAAGKLSINDEDAVYTDGHTRQVETLKTPVFDHNGSVIGVLGIARDITERKQLEIERQALTDDLIHAQEVAQIGNWSYQVSDGHITWSRQMFKIFGRESYSGPGPTHEELLSWIHPDDRSSHNASYETILKSHPGESIDNLTYRLLTPEGEERWAEATFECEFTPGKELVKIFGTLQDITERREAENKLIESEARFRNFFEQAPLPYQSLDSSGHFLAANEAWRTTLGYEPDEIIGKSFADFLTGPSKERFKTNFKRFKELGEVHNVQFEMKHKDNSLVQVEFEGRIGRDKEGNFAQTHCLLADVTEQKRAREQIQILSQAVEQSPTSVIITDPQGRIEYVNSHFEKVTGYTMAEVVGKNPSILKSGRTPSSSYRQLWLTLTNGDPWRGDFQNRKKNGELFWERAHIAPLLNSSGEVKHYVGVKEDITQQKLQDEKIIHQAHFDALTKLPNRFLVLDRLTQLINEAKRSNSHVVVMFIDLDDFKKVNDTLGHETGDELLIEASSRLLHEVRSGDTVGRLGGDEFLLLLGGVHSPADIQLVAKNLINSFREPFKIYDRELILTASIGIALYPDDGTNASELLRSADSAMFHSKDQGRNLYSFFTEEMNLEISRRVSLEEQMHGALDRDEFSIVYQPQISISTGKIVGGEALLRWRNPVLGDIPPTEFIPVAEQTGLIVSLGMYVMKQALNQAKEWLQFTTDFRMAINLSPRQFRDPSLVDQIRKLAQQIDIDIQHIELEITEGVLMSGHSYIDKALTEISRLGINISMDDFGTGYSSLSYLRSYPFNVLKIDQGFIKDITVDPADRELINATVAMSHGLNLKVVAEGVETEEQLDYLKKIGCDYAQGYLFSRPVTAAEFTGLLNTDNS